jgi:hypothetical protein
MRDSIMVSVVGVVLLYNHLSPYSRAESIDTSEVALRELYRRAFETNDYRILRRLAQNPKCPSDILQELSRSQHSGVSYRAINNPNVPLTLLEKLSSHPNPGIRNRVAGHSSTPREVLERLANDSDKLVSGMANFRLNGRAPIPADEKLGTLNNLLDLLFD